MSDPAERTVFGRSLTILARFLPVTFGVLGAVTSALSQPSGALPLMDRGASIGLTAAVACFFAAVVMYPIARHRVNRTQQWRRHSLMTRVGFDTVVLTFAHGLISFLLCLGTFGLFQLGFVDLSLDPVAGAVLCGVATYGAAALAAYSASIPSTVHYTNVLITLLVSGCVGAMLIARDSTWWQRDFSQLGGLGNLGSLTLNVTLVTSGLGVLALGDYVAHELERYGPQVRAGGVRLIRWLLGAAGLLMVLIGAIPVSMSRPVHVAFAMAMALTLIVLMAVTPLVVLGFDRGFLWASGGAVGAVVAAIFLSRVVGYFTWTAVEVVSATVIFGWITVFVRRLAQPPAGGGVTDRSADASVPRSGRVAEETLPAGESAGGSGLIADAVPDHLRGEDNRAEDSSRDQESDSRPNPNRPDPNRPDPNRTDPTRTDPTRSTVSSAAASSGNDR